MFKKTKKSVIFALVIILISSMMIQPMHAASIDDITEIQPRWLNAATMILTLDLAEPEILIAVTVTGYSGTTYTNGVATLEKISGSNCGVVKTWTGISSSTPVLTFKDSSVSRTRGTYRLTFTVTTVRNGVSETISSSKEATY